MNQEQAKEMLELLRKLVETTTLLDERLSRIERFTMGSSIQRGPETPGVATRYFARTIG